MALLRQIRLLRHACAAAALGAAGCASQAGPSLADGPAALAAEAQLELAPPKNGFQLATQGASIEPGDDVRWCEALRLPGGPDEVYFVDRLELALAPGARDLIVSEARQGSETEALMEVGMRVPCTRAGEAFGEDLVELVSTQRAREDVRLPSGVGYVLHGGQKIALDYLYANAGDEPIATQIKLNFHTVDASRVQRVASTASFNNLTIYTPPRGRSSHLAECSFSQDVWVAELVRRTQQRGTAFKVWVVGGEHDGQLVWHSTGPDQARTQFAEPLRLEAGAGLRFQCDYLNTSDRELRFGVNASDERCTLGTLYWPVDEQAVAAGQDCLLFDVDADGVARK